jgi:hypothetical protein
VGTPIASRNPGAWRVSAEVDGVDVWFESSSLPLVPSPEGFASAFLVPALAHRRRLVSAATLDAAWLANAPKLVEIFHRWWRYPRLVPESGTASPGALPAHAGPPRERALFFSGGVDSFHALLGSKEAVDRLVFVEGLDIRLGEAPRMEATLAGIREVAAATAKPLTVVRTNLREHPLIRDTSWERANGGALAAIAHALAGAVEEMLIASSVAAEWGMPWGSHWETDPLFSSSRLRLREVDEDQRRIDKVRRIAGHPLPQKHLRVCWLNRTPASNCSKCGKCVITRLMLAESGMLDRFALLEGTATLAGDIDALPHDTNRQSLTDLVTHGNLDPELRRSAEALLRRIARVQSFPVKTRRAVIRTVLGWFHAVRRD